MFRLEHANLSVVNTEAIERFLIAAFPDFHRRGEGIDHHGPPVAPRRQRRLLRCPANGAPTMLVAHRTATIQA